MYTTMKNILLAMIISCGSMVHAGMNDYPAAEIENCIHFVWGGGPQPIINVCGSSSSLQESPGEFLFPDGFDRLTTGDPDGKQRTIYDNNGEGPHEPARFKVIPGKGIRYITEIHVREADIDHYYPIEEQDILCDKKECTLTKETCVLRVPQDVDSSAVADYERATKKAEKSPILNEKDLVADRLMVRALAGDATAAQYLRALRAPTGDEIASEAIAETQSRYENIRALCSGLP